MNHGRKQEGGLFRANRQMLLKTESIVAKEPLPYIYLKGNAKSVHAEPTVEGKRFRLIA